MPWYHFSQNNSGGSFTINKNVAEEVFIEAQNVYTANNLGLIIGLYFDGVEQGIDCKCCGSRWYRTKEEISIADMMEYIYKYLPEYSKTLRVHCLDGTVYTEKDYHHMPVPATAAGRRLEV